MKTLRTLAGISLLFLAAQALPNQAAEPATPNAALPGIQVGQKAPDFTLTDQAGQSRSLKDLLAKGKLALVFHRSADW